MKSDTDTTAEPLVPDPAVRPTITIEETCAIFGFSRSSAYLAAKRGDIPTIKLGRRLVVPTAALRRMLGMSNDAEVA